MKVFRFSKINQHSIIKITLLFLLFVLTSSVMSQAADFVGSPTSGTVPLQVTFTDQSQGTIFSWYWTFEGGSPPTATTKGPHVVTYHTPGHWDVTLIVTPPPLLFASDTLKRNNYIHVYAPPRDFGDAPDDTSIYAYHTRLVNDGARHVVDSTLYLGSYIDAEPRTVSRH